MGLIYYKQEKFSLAEVHFRKALTINPQSSALLCHIGVVSLCFSVHSIRVDRYIDCFIMHVEQNSPDNRGLITLYNIRSLQNCTCTNVIR